MIDLLVKVGVNAAALLVAANVVPEFSLVFKTDKPEDWIQILVIALLFAVVNSYIKPIVKMLAMPIGFMTMGLVAFVINAGMVLGIAWIVNQAKDTLTIVISVVGTILNVVLVPRKAVGF